ncbi:MAG: hypothetical protein EOP74_01285 [Variovorax sp.]|nr:MAG: hypothetical protein EOP74_01285 [Variovorax sp.]
MILVKTDAGQQVLKDRSVRLTPRQRSAFILCDGKRSVDQVLAAGMGIGHEDIDQMIELGLLGPVGDVIAPAESPAPVTATSVPVVSQVASAPFDAAAATARLVSESAASATYATAGQAAPARSRQQRYQEAYPIATRLTGGLGLRGFRLNLAVEGTSSYEELVALAPKIRSAVGPDKSADLDRALGL